MPSEESQILAIVFKDIAANFPPDDNHYLSRCVYDQVVRAGAECPTVASEDTIVSADGLNIPCTEKSKHVVLFMHGGGFAFGSTNSHRLLAAHLGQTCGCPLLSVDYRLAPENKFPAAVDNCLATYKYLLKDLEFQADKIIVSGDSCGGGLSTAVPLALMNQGLPLPGASVSLSPWYDLDNTGGGTMESNAKNDVLGTQPFIERLIRYYADGNTVGARRSDPLISPLFASAEDLAKLPPHWISVGGYDTLRDHGERMAARLTALGVDTVLQVHEGQQHVMEFMAGKAPEAIKSLEDIGKRVKVKVGACVTACQILVDAQSSDRSASRSLNGSHRVTQGVGG